MAVLALLLGRHLAKRLSRPGHKEDRVIAKTRLAAPLGDDLASAFAFEELRLTIGRRQRDHAHKARQPRPRHTVQPAQQLRGALLLGRARAGRPDFARAVSAFRRAFSAYVSPTSSTSLSNATMSTPASDNRSRYSRSLPVFPEAMTSRGRSHKPG